MRCSAKRDPADDDEALAQLPANVIVPARLVLTSASGRAVAEQVIDPSPPTELLRALMAGEPGEDVPTA